MDTPSSFNNESNFLELDCTEIPDYIRQKAEKELGETDSRKERCLKELRECICKEADLKADTSIVFLLKFLRVRKFNTHLALKLLKHYYKHRLKYPSLYKNYTPDDLKDVMLTNVCTLLPNRTQDGCAIYVVRIGMWDTGQTRFEDVLKFGLLCNEKALEYEVTQISGIVTIVDLKGFSWSHLISLPPSSIRCFVSASQDCFPIRHRAIHIINNRSIFEIIFSLMKPLIKKEMAERIHFHGDDLSSLHRHLSPDILPEEFGGTQKFANEAFYTTMLNGQEIFTNNLTFGYGKKE